LAEVLTIGFPKACINCCAKFAFQIRMAIEPSGAIKLGATFFA
jgi:hypothetical protein